MRQCHMLSLVDVRTDEVRIGNTERTCKQKVIRLIERTFGFACFEQSTSEKSEKKTHEETMRSHDSSTSDFFHFRIHFVLLAKFPVSLLLLLFVPL